MFHERVEDAVITDADAEGSLLPIQDTLRVMREGIDAEIVELLQQA